ncbi:MAG: hypothetical protein RQ745_06460 [Longimicrobiales bacterium]|nr:hypothetical protein [Longimicrobiales bacterium]
MFEFLFKYRPVLFESGDFTFRTPWPVGLVVIAAVIFVGVAVLTYRGTGRKATPADRGILSALRIAALAVLLFSLLQPTLVLESVVEQRNFVGVLLDNSRSMTLPQEGGGTRADFIRETFGAEGSEVVDALNERFSVRYFHFGNETGRVESADALRFDGTRTDLASALVRAQETLSSVPLSGLVVVSDGASNAGPALAEALVPLQAASLPVYSVGLGPERLDPDIQVDRVELPRSVLRGSDIVVDVPVTQRGFARRSATLVVEDGARRLTEVPLDFGEDGEAVLARARFTLDEAGPRALRFRVPVQEGEEVARNNARDLLIDVREDREKILYFEGEPRYEVKFLRRAIWRDENIQVVVLQRTADGKYLRLDVDDGDELVTGFPRSREELFQYRAIILGSVEASLFTADQLEMLADFVSVRGGGLLLLGGRSALAEGGFAGTALEEVSPVLLEEPAADPRSAYTQVRVRPTPAGRAHPVSNIGEAILPEAAEVAEGVDLDDPWATLPPLSTMNRVVRTRPGASTLLLGTTPGGEDRVVLASQRYGRGTSIAFPVQDSWIWQMDATVGVEDQRHERFWQQLLRWLVEDVARPVSVTPEREQVESDESVPLTAEVLDSAYLAVNAAAVVASVTAPGGTVVETPLRWTIEEDGIYRGSVTLTEPGVHTIEVVATRDGETLGSSSSFVQVGPSDEEYFDAARRTASLRRLAEVTGGRFYTPSTIHDLPEDLRFTGAGVTRVDERDLWDMPILLLLLLGLIGAEWGYRRFKGLV